MAEQICSNNVLDFQKRIDEIYPDNYFSAFTYLSWSTYGINLSYSYNSKYNSLLITANSNLKYLSYTSNIYGIDVIENVNKRHLILAPIAPNQSLFIQALKEQIELIMKNCENCQGVYVDDVSNEQLELINKNFEAKQIFKTISNYIYPTIQLEKMAGRKMQKKRNHLNFYLKNYSAHTKIKKLSEISFSEIINYLNLWSSKSEKFDIDSEIVFVEMCKELIKTEILKGIGLYLNDILIGITISYEHGNICEILVEHANKNIRGSYQYLLSKNISINHSNTEYVDRQDDAWSKDIDHSKRTYKPIKIIEKNFILIKGINNANK